mgnify:CR=1 FL=1
MQIAPWVFPLTKETASVPRMCGEKIRAVSATTASVESPPRMRGKVLVLLLGVVAQRITPACAGKRPAQTSAGLRRRDHPRVCGEKRSRLSDRFLRGGSPPRMRGKDVLFCYMTQFVGITPAYAGKSALAFFHSGHLANFLSTITARITPRVCGESHFYQLR